MASKKETKRKVLIIGGGFAGLGAARELSSTFKVTVVDPKSFFECVPCAPRALVSPASASKSLVDYPSTYTKQGLVVALQTDGIKGTATLQSGETLEFDFCLISTGSSYPSGIKADLTLQNRAQRLKQFVDIHAKITAAKTVLVVGGGAVGVDLAAEVAESFPNKKVTIVASAGLLDRMAPSAQQYANKWMEAHNVEVLGGERISDWGGLSDGKPAAVTLKTNSGRTLDADIAFKCVGGAPNTAAFAASLAREQLGPRGAIEVLPTLRVKGWPNVFAAGDCNSIDEEKTAAMAGLSAIAAAANITALDSGKELKPYLELMFGGVKPPMSGGASLGHSEGVMQMGTNVQMGKMPAMMKTFITWMLGRIAGGSKIWAVMYRGMQSVLAAGMAREARREASAAGLAGVVPAAG